MTVMRIVMSVVAATLISAGLLSGCSSSSSGSIVAHLESFPALEGDEFLVLTYTDYERLEEQTGVERPSGDDADELERWFVAVVGFDEESQATVAGQHPQAFSRIRSVTLELDSVYGVDIVEVGSFLEAFDGTTSWRGDFDADRLEEELGRSENGVWDASGESERPAPRTPANVAQVDDYLVLTDDMGALRELSAGESSAADDEDLLAVAEALDDAGVYAAQLIRWGDDFEAATAAFTGLGLADTDDASVLTIVYAFPDESAAEAAEAWIEEYVDDADDTFSLGDVTGDGTMVTATVEVGGDAPLSRVWGLVSHFEPLILGGPRT